MARYSMSKLHCFDTCKLQYKYRYIDKIKVDTDTIERFLGKRVHEALELLYQRVMRKQEVSEEWLLQQYENSWKEKYHGQVKIVRKEYTAQEYYNKGVAGLRGYYAAYTPFNQAKVLDTERAISFVVKADGAHYDFYGILDRLDFNQKEGVFEIHDYKTSSSMMSQKQADEDWQLALYHLGLLSKWPQAVKVKLVWHYLMFNQEMVSLRNAQLLDDLQKRVVCKIQHIEQCTQFVPQKSVLCNWCDYHGRCPLWQTNHSVDKRAGQPVQASGGAALVTRYAQLEDQKAVAQKKIFSIEQEQQKILDEVRLLCIRDNITTVEGSQARFVLEVTEELRAPTRKEDQSSWEKLRELLIKEDKYVDSSTVNSNMLISKITNQIWPNELIEKIKKYLKRRIVHRIKFERKQ